MYTLGQYNKAILRPMALHHTESGMFDNIIFDQNLDIIYANDKVMMEAINKRRAILQQKTKGQ